MRDEVLASIRATPSRIVICIDKDWVYRNIVMTLSKWGVPYRELGDRCLSIDTASLIEAFERVDYVLEVTEDECYGG